MPREVRWTGRAEQDICRLSRPDAYRVRAGVQCFAETGHGDVRRLKGDDRATVLRVGDWRIWFKYDVETGAVVVLYVRNRREAYR